MMYLDSYLELKINIFPLRRSMEHVIVYKYSSSGLAVQFIIYNNVVWCIIIYNKLTMP